MKRSQEILAASGDALSICSSEKFYLIAMHYVQSYYIKSMIDVYGVKAKGHIARRGKQHDVIEIGRELFLCPLRFA